MTHLANVETKFFETMPADEGNFLRYPCCIGGPVTSITYALLPTTSLIRFPLSLLQHMVQTGMTSPYPAAFPTQNGNQGDPPLKPVSDMKSDLVGPTGDKGGGGGVGGGGGGGGQVVNAQQAVTNGQMQMANGEPTTQNVSTVRELLKKACKRNVSIF